MQTPKHLLIATALLITVIATAGAQCIPDKPKGLQTVNVTSCSATLKWKSIPNISFYKVRFRTISTAWSHPVKVIDTSYVFSGLTAGTNFTFSVASFCSGGSQSKWTSKSATTALCASVLNTKVTFPEDGSVRISVISNCNSAIYYCRYKHSSGGWTTVSASTAEIDLNNLLPDSTYYYQIVACSDTVNNWCQIRSFQMPALLATHPNIILIILDDAMYNVYSCNGAPSFFKTPNIDRIAHEGINFQNSFVVTSLCMPSRAVIATGLFPTRTEVFSNDEVTDVLDTSFVVLSERLRPQGYYTALVGKNHNTFGLGVNSEFDYSMVANAVIDNYASHSFTLNGQDVYITGNTSMIMGDTVAALISRTQDPLFVWMAFRVPHYPMKPMESFGKRYDQYTVPFGPDTAVYTQNYPSVLYDMSVGKLLPSDQLDSVWHVMYEVIGGVDSAIGHILNALDSSGKAQNTLVIFTSDNGFLLGVHGLNCKELAYEPSMRVPLFVRYPNWFSPAVIRNTLALNLDIAPTVLEAAGIQNVPLDGISLRRFYSGDTSRSEFYYLMKHAIDKGRPTWRAIRDFDYKYVTYTCSSITEELFDMHDDTLELNNLINGSQYQSLIQSYRSKLLAYKTFYDDTLPDPIDDCSIENPVTPMNSLRAEASANASLLVYPNPSAGELNLTLKMGEMYSGNAQLQVCNELGQITMSKLVEVADGNLMVPLSVPKKTPSGIYFVRVITDDREFLTTAVISK